MVGRVRDAPRTSCKHYDVPKLGCGESFCRGTSLFPLSDLAATHFPSLARTQRTPDHVEHARTHTRMHTRTHARNARSTHDISDLRPSRFLSFLTVLRRRRSVSVAVLVMDASCRKRTFLDTPQLSSKRLRIGDLSVDVLGHVVRWSSVPTLCNFSQVNQFFCVFVRERAKALFEEIEKVERATAPRKSLYVRMLSASTLYGLKRLCAQRLVVPVRFFRQMHEIIQDYDYKAAVGVDVLEFLLLIFGYEETVPQGTVDVMEDVLSRAVLYKRNEEFEVLRRRHVERALVFTTNLCLPNKKYTLGDYVEDPFDADYEPSEFGEFEEECEETMGVIVGFPCDVLLSPLPSEVGMRCVRTVAWRWSESTTDFISEFDPYDYALEIPDDANPCKCYRCTDYDDCNTEKLFYLAQCDVAKCVLCLPESYSRQNMSATEMTSLLKAPRRAYRTVYRDNLHEPQTDVERAVDKSLTAVAHRKVNSSEYEKFVCVKDVALAQWREAKLAEWRQRAIANPEDELGKLGIEFQRGKTWHDAELLNQMQRPT